MSRFENPVLWSFHCLRWRGIGVRISPLFGLAAIPLCVHYGFLTGVLITLVTLLTVILHSAARLLILDAGELSSSGLIVLWPMGDLAARRVGGPRGMGKGYAECCAGLLVPAVMAVLCLTVIYPYAAPEWGKIIRSMPALTGKQPLYEGALLLLAINIKLLMVNICPMRSTDVGRSLEYFLTDGWDEEDQREISLKSGLFAGMIVAVFAASQELWWLFAACSVLSALTISELSLPMRSASLANEETFLGYDFSAGYTSLEGAGAESLVHPGQKQGLMGRWLARQEEERRRKERVEAKQVEWELDRILGKVHDQGVNSLTAEEKQLLNRASAQFRRRGTADSR